jgi:hypothetical protein
MTPELVALETQIVTGLVGLAGIAIPIGIGWASVKLQAIATAHKQTAVAAQIAAATPVLQAALQTSASTIAGKIASGALPLNDRAAWVAEATREVGLVAQRVPGAVAVLEPAAGAMVASMMGKVDAAVVASPTIPSSVTGVPVFQVPSAISVGVVGRKPVA